MKSNGLKRRRKRDETNSKKDNNDGYGVDSGVWMCCIA